MTYSEKIIEFSTSQVMNSSQKWSSQSSSDYLIYKLIYDYQLELNGFWKEVIRNLHVAHTTHYTAHAAR